MRSSPGWQLAGWCEVKTILTECQRAGCGSIATRALDRIPLCEMHYAQTIEWRARELDQVELLARWRHRGQPMG